VHNFVEAEFYSSDAVADGV